MVICDITPMLVEHFKRQRREGITRRGTKRNMATVNRELTQLTKIFSLAVDYDYCETNPCRKVKRFRVDNRRERVLTTSEEAELFDVLTGRYAASILHVPGEITKNGRPRDIPLNGAALSALQELKERAPAANHVLSGLGYSKWTLCQRFSEAGGGSAGIADVTLHTLRHTFATRLKDVGVDPFTVRDLLGHATIQMTNYYTHATPETMRRGVQALSEATRGSTGIVPAHLREIA